MRDGAAERRRADAVMPSVQMRLAADLQLAEPRKRPRALAERVFLEARGRRVQPGRRRVGARKYTPTSGHTRLLRRRVERCDSCSFGKRVICFARRLRSQKGTAKDALTNWYTATLWRGAPRSNAIPPPSRPAERLQRDEDKVKFSRILKPLTVTWVLTKGHLAWFSQV